MKRVHPAGMFEGPIDEGVKATTSWRPTTTRPVR